MSLLLLSSARFSDHVTPPGHPERVERGAIMENVAGEWARRGGSVRDPRAASRAELLRVHTPDHLDAIDSAAGRSMSLDPDTFTSPDSRDVALLAAGAVLTGVEAVIREEATRALALVRPPGHHAEADRAMGFCLYNNVAAGAAHALALGLERVVVIDYDVHHGNGTQAIFYDDPQVLYISTHQYPFYPGTGAAEEVGGGGEGAGYTVNIPLEAGATDGDYQEVFRTIVIPVIDQFRPDLLMISAGFDAHELDPLARMRLSTSGYASLTTALCDAANRHCRGRVVAVTEGGYHLKALHACLKSTVDVLAGSSTPIGSDVPSLEPTDRSRAAITAVRAAQSKYWRI
jgi:acetoin utilization deacetylase AcuC-like enzyme